MRPAEERRKTSRVPVRIELGCKAHKGKEEHKAVSYDVSGLGFGINVTKRLKTRADIKLTLRKEKFHRSVIVTGKIAWCRPSDKGMFKAGIEVLSVSDPSAFIDIMCNELDNVLLVEIIE